MGFGCLSARRCVNCILFVIGVAVAVSALAAAAPAGVRRQTAGKIWPTYSDPAWSKTNRIAFVRNAGGDESLWVMNSDGTQARQILAGTELHTRGWSPDGARLLYTDGDAAYVVNADGTGRQALPASITRDAAWSPDGTRIAYSVPGYPGGAHIHVVDISGANDKDLGYVGGDPAWSPDGSKLVFDGSDGSCNCTNELLVAPSDGSAEPQTFVTGSTVGEPAWSPDGGTIAFWAITSGYTKAIWTAKYPVTEAPRVLASTEVSLTGDGVNTSGGNVEEPRWSPDGTRIVFARAPNLTRAQAVCLKQQTSCPVHPQDVYVVNKDGNGLKDLTFSINGGSSNAQCLRQSEALARAGASAVVQLCFERAAGRLHGRKLTISGRLGPSGAHIPTVVRAQLQKMTGYPTIWRIRVRSTGTFAASRTLTMAQLKNLRTFRDRVPLKAGPDRRSSDRTSTTVHVKRG